MLESKIQSKIIKYLEANDCTVLKVTISNMSGIADLIVFPGDGRVFFLEVKNETGIESPLQKFRREGFTDVGYTWEVVRSVEEAQEIFDKFKQCLNSDNTKKI